MAFPTKTVWDLRVLAFCVLTLVIAIASYKILLVLVVDIRVFDLFGDLPRRPHRENNVLLATESKSALDCEDNPNSPRKFYRGT